MTLGKNQLQVSSDEEQEEEDDLDRAALDNILIRNASAIKDIPGKGKIIQVDRRQFQDIDEKVAKQKAAEAFRQRFIMKAKAKAPSTNGLGVGDDDDINDDIDEFLGGLNLEGKSYGKLPIAVFLCFHYTIRFMQSAKSMIIAARDSDCCFSPTACPTEFRENKDADSGRDRQGFTKRTGG